MTDDVSTTGPRVVELITDLLSELHPDEPRPRVRSESTLDRELGLDSLELVELLDRLEAAFGVQLPEDLLGSARTAGDLVGAVGRAARHPTLGHAISPWARRKPSSQPARSELFHGAIALPELGRTSTLLEVLALHVRAHPHHRHVRILGAHREDPPQDLTYVELEAEARAASVRLWELGVGPGDAVALMLPTGRDFFVMFFGVLFAGAVPVPIYPPARASQFEEHVRRQARILANARAVVLVTVREAQQLARGLRALVPSLRLLISADTLRTSSERLTSAIALQPDDTALLQYTSGSTAHPKGVVLSHRNLLANLRAMGAAVAATPEDVFVSWLPLYHDMGLIGAWLGSLYHGFTLVVMSPLTFLTRPVRWLQAIHDHRASLSGAPNFAYELCVRRIPDRALDELDLSTWRWAFNGAEPVSPTTLERFRERFARCGLRPEAIAPVYGLAEAAVGLTFPPTGRGPLVDRIDREAFVHSGRARPTEAEGPSALRFVSCGRPLLGHAVRVVDAAGHELGEREEGTLEFRGPSATRGYYRDPEATARLFDGAWLDTGDLGYIAGGELYVTGRVKDVILRAGRTLHPEELEEAIGEVPGVRKGCVAVFASADHVSGTERIVVLAETREVSPEAVATLRTQVRARASELVGVSPDEVVLAPPHTVPKTSSGKIRRAASRELYERGEIARKPVPMWRQLWRLGRAGIVPGIRRWRRVMSTLAYSLGMWTLLLMVGTPVWFVLVVLPGQSRRRRLMRATARLLVRLSGSTLTAQGTEHLRKHGPFVLVANHPSFLDGLVLLAALPLEITFVAASEFSAQLVAGSFLRRLGTVFVERGLTSGAVGVDLLQDALRRGETLGIFPEGGLSPAPGLRPFHLGAFVAAAEAMAPVVPVAIRGTRSMLRPGHRLVHRGPVEIEVGPPITPTDRGWHAAVRLQQQARALVLEHCGEPAVAGAPTAPPSRDSAQSE